MKTIRQLEQQEVRSISVNIIFLVNSNRSVFLFTYFFYFLFPYFLLFCFLLFAMVAMEDYIFFFFIGQNDFSSFIKQYLTKNSIYLFMTTQDFQHRKHCLILLLICPSLYFLLFISKISYRI